MSCLKLSICKETGERVYLDLPIGFDIRETKQLTELTEADKLKFDYQVANDLPNTPTNRRCLSDILSPNKLDNDFKAVPLQIEVGSNILTQNEISVLKCTSKLISINIRLRVNHWARGSKDLRLCDLPYDDVEITCELIQDINFNEWPYSPTNTGVYFPYANYGLQYRDFSQNAPPRSNNWVVPVALWRPWFYILGLLERGFCELGFDFCSPFFESDLGKKLGAYLGDPNFGLTDDPNNPDKSPISLDARAVINDPYLLGFNYGNSKVGIVNFPYVQFDNRPNFILQNGEVKYKADGCVDIEGRVNINPGNDDDTITVKLVKILTFNPDPVYITLAETTFTNSYSWEFDVQGVTTTDIEQIAVIVIRNTTDLVAIESGYIEFTGIRKYMSIGSTYNWTEFLDCNITFLELLKGLSHIGNIKFVTDFVYNKVYMYTPYDQDFWGENIEGFYIEDTIESLVEKVDPKSILKKSPVLEQARIQRLMFKDCTDDYLDDRNSYKDRNRDRRTERATSIPLYSTDVDLGDNFTINEIINIENPLFAATYNNMSNTTGIGVHAPIMGVQGAKIGSVGNDLFKDTWGQCPRIGIFFGNVVQDFSVLGLGTQPQIRYCNDDGLATNLIPTVSQFVPIGLGQHNVTNGTISIPEENLIFGVDPSIYQYPPATTLYDLVYKRWMREQLANMTIEALIYMNRTDFKRYNFRNLFCFNVEGRQVIGRMIEIKDFHNCKKIPTIVSLKPKLQVTDICDLTNTGGGSGTDDCNNLPFLICNFLEVGGTSCWFVSISGINNDPIVSVVFEQSLDQMVWSPVQLIPPITGRLCNLIEKTWVRAIVTYENCPDITTPEKCIDPCPEFDLSIDCIAVQVIVAGIQQDGLFAQITLPSSLNINVVSAQVNVDSTGFVPYNFGQVGINLNGDVLSGGTIYDFEVVLQIGNCPEFTLTKTCNINTTTTGGCEDINISLECVSVGGGCFTFVRTGIIPFEYDGQIKYRCSDDGITFGEWLDWDGEPVCCLEVQAKWIVNFCDDRCPMICTPIVSCGGCSIQAEISSSVKPCLHEIRLENVDDGSNTYSFITKDNEEGIFMRARCIVTNCAGEVSNIIIEENFDVQGVKNVKNNSGIPYNFITLTSMVICDNVSGNSSTLDLNPLTTPYLTGCSGNVVVSDLTWVAGNNANYITALTTLIENALCTAPYNATSGVDYKLVVSVLASGLVGITFDIKHNPVGQWIGFCADTFLTWESDQGSGVSTQLGGGLSTTIRRFDCKSLVCNGDLNLRIVTNYFSGFGAIVNPPSGTEYNQLLITPNYTPTLTLNNNLSILDGTCDAVCLDITSDCTPTNIQWYKDGNQVANNSSTLTVVTGGEYWAIVTCDNCSVETNHIII